MTTRNKTSKSAAGRLGGLARIARHGNPGTQNGRSRGGHNSILVQRGRESGFKTLAKIQRPPHSPALAEFFGILAGDGHINLYQVTVSTNSRTDVAHAKHVQQLAHSLFGISVTCTKRANKNVLIIVISSRAVTDYLVQNGLNRGNKVLSQIAPPQWILANPLYTMRYVRGLFDTDGCVFVDNHTIRGKQYRNIGIAFTNYSKPLLECFKQCLESMGLHPTQKTANVVFLRRKNDVAQYFKLVGSSNEKHLNRYKSFLSSKNRKQGRVA